MNQNQPKDDWTPQQDAKMLAVFGLLKSYGVTKADIGLILDIILELYMARFEALVRRHAAEIASQAKNIPVAEVTQVTENQPLPTPEEVDSALRDLTRHIKDEKL